MEPRLAARALALVFLLVPVLPPAAETFLVAVAETDDGAPSPPPSAAREGIFAALFDAEHIAFELPSGEKLPSTDELRRLAIEAGAGTVAIVMVDWHREPMSGGALRVRARGSIVLVDALTGHETHRRAFEVANEGRELTAGRPRLGAEIGSALVEAFRATSAAR
jgi:hypothetical protein